MSRLSFKKVYTVEHNVKVMNVGRVARGLTRLPYWRNTIAPLPQRRICVFTGTHLTYTFICPFQKLLLPLFHNCDIHTCSTLSAQVCLSSSMPGSAHARTLARQSGAESEPRALSEAEFSYGNPVQII
jgi:hypothetical protein